jgi:exonuclease VII large subunit
MEQEELSKLKEQVRIMKIDCIASLNWRIGKEAEVRGLREELERSKEKLKKISEYNELKRGYELIKKLLKG